jgi:hypothetical protein
MLGLSPGQQVADEGSDKRDGKTDGFPSAGQGIAWNYWVHKSPQKWTERG